MTDEKPSYAAVVAYNRERGEATRRRVYAAMQALGPNAKRREIVALVGINPVSVGRAMRAIRGGWKP